MHRRDIREILSTPVLVVKEYIFKPSGNSHMNKERRVIFPVEKLAAIKTWPSANTTLI